MANLTLDNPFVFNSHKSDSNHKDNDEQSAKAEYAIVRRGDVVAPEIDREGMETIEVTVRWGRTVLGVAHLKKGESLSIGEDDRGSIMVPQELLGARSWKLIDRGTLSVPVRAKVDGVAKSTLARGDKVRFSLAAQDSTDAEQSSDKDIFVQVACVTAARPTPRGGNLRRSVLAVGAISFLAHLGVVAALAFAPGESLSTDDSPLDKETTAHMIALNQAADMHETPQQEEESSKDNAGGDTGQAHSGPSGMAGALTAKPNNAAYQLKGPPETKEEHLASVRTLIETNNYGAIGALASVMGSMKGPTDPMSAFADQAGTHDQAFDGNVTGKEPGDSFGYMGLGLTGNEWGGGGNGPGIGLGPVGGFGHAPGDGGTMTGFCASGENCTGVVNPKKKHDTVPVKIYDPNTNIEGSLPMEVVKRIVHANFPRLRACYDQGLKMDPSLRGTITTRFIIDSTGAVETASLVSSTMSNPNVSTCVVGVFSTLSFPSPENGKARVTYPISFDHDE